MRMVQYNNYLFGELVITASHCCRGLPARLQSDQRRAHHLGDQSRVLDRSGVPALVNAAGLIVAGTARTKNGRPVSVLKLVSTERRTNDFDAFGRDQLQDQSCFRLATSVRLRLLRAEFRTRSPVCKLVYALYCSCLSLDMSSNHHDRFFCTLFAVTALIGLLISLSHHILDPSSAPLSSLPPPLVARRLTPTPSANKVRQVPRLPVTCSACSASEGICAKYGSRNLQRSRVYDGSGDRTQAVMRKALEGRGLTLAVIGGSGKYVFPI